VGSTPSIGTTVKALEVGQSVVARKIEEDEGK